MNIVSVIPSETGAATTIFAVDNNGLQTKYTYSHAHGLIYDPYNYSSWMGWNGGTLTEAIQFIISL